MKGWCLEPISTMALFRPTRLKVRSSVKMTASPPAAAISVILA